MENRAYALATGLFILLLAASVMLWARWLARETTTRTAYRVISTVPVSGLNVQAQVRYRGMSAGRVTDISLDPKDARRILIDIDVDENIPLTRGTFAQLGMEGITGIAYVHLLDDGKDPRPLPQAADGVGELPLRPSFFDTIADNAEGATHDVRELMANINALLTPENRARISTTIASLERLAANIETASAKLPAAIDRADARLGAWLAEDNRKLARESLEHFNETASAMPELARETQRLVQDTRALVEQVGKLAADARGATGGVREDTLPRVNALADSVERGAQRVGQLAVDLDRRPESLLWGRSAGRPGPGEPGFE